MSAKQSVKYAVGIAIFLAAAYLAGGPDEQQLEHDHYCKMVAAFKETKGEAGWPDYKGTFAESCAQSEAK